MPAALLVVLALVVALAGCQSSDTAVAAPDAADTAAHTAVIDVRTPAEYADSHVENAVNIDVNGPGFDAAVADLDPDGTYLVYCRSGNRSAQAADRMRAAGLSVQDGGGLQDMADAGYPFT